MIPRGTLSSPFVLTRDEESKGLESVCATPCGFLGSALELILAH
jgi:hypothetical protein